jgi:hypothetical protein
MLKAFAVALAIASGLLALVDYYVDHPVVDALGGGLAEGVVILAAFGLLVGVVNLVAIHSRRAAAGGPDRALSAVLVLALVATLGIGVAMPGSAALGWLFRYVYQPLEATLGALLAFFAVSAAYRAFRVQSVEAGILLVSTLLALVVQLPVVGTLVPYLAELRVWLFAVPVTAGVRGILLGVALGTIVTSLRVLLAVDYPYAAD